MLDMHVRLEPLAEPRCGYTHETAALLNRCYSVTAIEQIMLGLIIPQSVEMSLQAPINPLELILQVYGELQYMTFGMLLRFQLTLDRKNAGIIEKGRLLHFDEVKRARHTPTGGRARGTRSTRAHGKKKAGR